MSSHADLVGRYTLLRRKSVGINHELVRSLHKDALPTIARKFGMLQGREILFETEDESAVLMDACIHDYRVDGENTAERYLRQHPPAEGTDERLLLEALIKARYSIFEAKQAEPEVGVLFEDLLHGGEVFVWDVAFSHTAVPGALMAGRIFSPGPITMTTGSFLPVDEPLARKLLHRLKPYTDSATGYLKPTSPQRQSEIALLVTGTCVRGGASARIRYAGTGGTNRVRDNDPDRLTPIRAGDKVGRNDPCPCGSGKKHKKCCGK